jgi:hypothetical protein
MSDEDTMRMSESAVPICITETVVHTPQKIKRTRSFVGIRVGFTKLAYSIGIWALDRLEESFFEETVEVVEPGSRTETHFAIVVGSDGYGRTLEAIEVPSKPSCIHHYEIIRHAVHEKAKVDYISHGANKETQKAAEVLREPNRDVLNRIRQSLVEAGHEDNYFLPNRNVAGGNGINGSEINGNGSEHG